MRQYDVMTEKRTVPMIGFAPMPTVAPKHRLVRKPMKLTMQATPEKREKPKVKSELYYELDRAFAEVKLMLDGRLPEQTAEEFLEELRNEERNALLNSTNSGF